MTPKMLQVEEEIDALAEVIRREECRSLLEIGSKHGGSLLKLASAMPPGSRVVAVDKPGGTKEWKESQASLVSVAEDLRRQGYRVDIVWGDSTDRRVVDQVLSFAPFDALFIDANHTLPFVTKDWKTYGRYARIVAFHDIAWHRAPDWVGTRIDVPQFWESIKGDYRHEEFKFCPTGKNNGIGVLWRC